MHTILCIQISVSPEVAIQIVSSVEDLYQFKMQANVDYVMDLMEKAQRLVFAEMVPFWGFFCKFYQSPVESTVSLPQGIHACS